MNTAVQKKALRARYRALRKELPEGERENIDAAITRHVLALAEYKAAGTVFLYVSVGAEVDTRALLRQALAEGKRVVVPRCVAGEPGVMVLCRIQGVDELRPAPFGLLEPHEGCETVETDEVDLALVPALACDATGGRLGQGGGYYDRLLAHGHFPIVALCRNDCLCETIPREAWDVRVDMVATQHGVIRCGGMHNGL